MQDTRTPSSTGFRRRCAAWRVTLERPKVTKGLIPHLFALLRRVPSVQAKGLAERRRRYIPVPPASAPSSMTALLTLCPHLGEQQGATPNPQHRGRLTGVGCTKRSALHRGNSPCLFGAKIGRVVSSEPAPRPPHCESRLSHLCNRLHQVGCIGEKIMVSRTTNGTHAYRTVVLY